MTEHAERARGDHEADLPGSVAGSLVGSGAPALARSFRFHRPRGPFCGRGYCHQCPVRTGADDRSALACELPAGTAVRLPRIDPLRPLGRRAERMTPWFYERRFGSPRLLRQLYLRVLRHLSAAHALPDDPFPTATRGLPRELETDVLVVGTGPAGVAAARAAAASGRDVLVVGREGRPAGLTTDAPTLPRRVEALTGTTCLGIFDEEAVAGLVGPGGLATVAFERLVVATGAYDRPLAYAGNDLPGTIGLRAFERYAAAGAVGAGIRVGVVAGPREASRAVAAARAAGIRLAFVAGPADLPVDAGPLLPGRRLERVEGGGRVRSVQLEGEEPIACDVLVLGFSQPSFELQAQAGARLTVAGTPAVVLASGEARMPIVAVGGAAGHVELDDGVREAGAAVEAWLRDEPVEPAAVADLPEPARRHPDAFVCLCEDVRVRDVQSAIEAGLGSAELLKRRTGAGTGPCQGKLCLGEISETLRAAGLPTDPPTVRSPARPVSVAALAGMADA